jgi:hypothetical protein
MERNLQVGDTATLLLERYEQGWFSWVKGCGFILVTASAKSSISSNASRIFCGSGPT